MRTFLVLGFLALASSPLQAQEDVLDSVSWMAGCWVASGGETHIQEVWMAPRGGLMVGMNRDTRGGRVIVYEFLLMRPEGSGLLYSANPSGQQPTDFPSTSIAANRVVFEKPDHDFPQKIEYLQPNPDSLLARVFGGVDDAEPAFSVPFGRASCDGQAPTGPS